MGKGVLDCRRDPESIASHLSPPPDGHRHPAFLPRPRHCLRTLPPTATTASQMHGLVTRRRVQDGVIRSRLVPQFAPPSFARRTAHSGLLESICGDYQRGLTPSISGPFPQRTHNCGALSEHNLDSPVVLSGWLLPERFLSLGPPLPALTRFPGRYPRPFPSSPSRTRMAPPNWSSTVTPQRSTSSPPCQLSHPNPSSSFKGASDRDQSIPSAAWVSLMLPPSAPMF